MKLDRDICYRAVESRDRRFDGRFFTAVKTTGIYCRPICPAVTPRKENVEFHACAATAEAAGYRPCLRCRPERSPADPAWAIGDAVLVRALKLIDGGFLDRSSVADLGERVGLGDRHLRRLFRSHLETTPVRVATTRRMHLARRLIMETPLPLTEIAFASGFSSIRRFNAVFKESMGHAPGELRRGSGPSPDRVELGLSYRPPLDWDGLMAFMAGRLIPGVETLEDGVYRRAVRHGRRSGLIEVWHEGESVKLGVSSGLVRSLGWILPRVRRLFDLDADPHRIEAVLGRDSDLGYRPGIRVPGAFDPLETAARIILGQQVTVKGATTLAGRLVERLGQPLPDHPGYRTFPSAEALARDTLPLGVPEQRAQTLRRLADLDLGMGGDPALQRERLERIPGIGPWTAQVLAMRVLGDPDAFPDTDLGLKTLMNATPAALRRRAEPWRPWRAYAAMAIWSSQLPPRLPGVGEAP